jgi:hypothetical protein
MKRLLLSLSLGGLLAAALPIASSRAEGTPAPAAPAAAGGPAAAADSEGFVPDRRPANMTTVEEGLPAGPLVGAAYGFIWAAVLVFVGLTARRTRQLEIEVAQLAERLPPAAGGRAG